MIVEPSRLSSHALDPTSTRTDVSRALSGLVVLSVGRGGPDQEAVNQVLKSAGAVVLVRASAADTAQILRAFIPSVVVIDVAADDGGEAASAVVRTVRRLPPEAGGALPVIGICRRTADDLAAVREKFQALLVHPFGAADVARTVRRAIEASS
jgi:DNA-binding NtrC family response regulator